MLLKLAYLASLQIRAYTLVGVVSPSPFYAMMLSWTLFLLWVELFVNAYMVTRFLDVEISIFVKNIRIVGPALAECFLFHIPVQCAWPVPVLLSLPYKNHA